MNRSKLGQDNCDCRGAGASIAAALALALSSAAMGQAFNIDLGTGSGIPAATYAAAGLQAGTWQQIPAVTAGVPIILVNTGGLPTPVTMVCNNANASLNVNNALTSGNDQALLDDFLNMGGAGATDTFTISGMTPGQYHVTVYAWAPDNAAFVTGVNIAGQGVQNCGGTFAGLVDGVTHVDRVVTVGAGGSFTIVTSTVTSFSSLNGLQIRPLASVCGNGGNCYETTPGQPGCGNAECCATICAGDDFCCTVEWDQLCVDAALEVCGNCGNEKAGNCFAEHGPGCSDFECCGIVCAIDEFCCDTEWDDICVDEALELCIVPKTCGEGADSNCFTESGAPGCTDNGCCALVCSRDSFCCESEWDDICVDEALELCGNCGGPRAGSCFKPDDTPGCDDVACCATVCAVDQFCCVSEWDRICADEATDLCSVCGNEKAGNCYMETLGTPGCSNADCCNLVCGLDAFCCETEWDDICAGEAAEFCGGCGDEKAGSCFETHGPGCENFDCCATVCAVDEFCCDNEWDEICVDEAGKLCNACANPRCPADIDGDTDVDGVDLGILLNSWSDPAGTPGCDGAVPCCADIDGDTDVDGVDLGILLNSWSDPAGSPGCQ